MMEVNEFDRAFGRRNIHRDLAILLLTVVACAIPFLRQPFHVDDNFYMDMARNAQVRPLYPNDVPYVFEGRRVPDMGSHSHPPLMTYFLAAVQRFAGEGPGREASYHFAALLFPVLAVWAFYFFSARVVSRPLWPSLALACCPLFLVMQHTLMTDVPTLAFLLAAVAAFVWATDLGSPGLYAASALFQFAAMFTSYQAATLLPLLAYYHVRRRGRALGWAALVLPLLLLAGWFGINSLHYHRWLLGNTFGWVRSRGSTTTGALLTKLTAVLEYQGWLILFPFFVLYAFGRAWKGRVAALLLVGAVYLAQLSMPQYRLIDKLIFIVGLAAGASVLIVMARVFTQSVRAASGTTVLDEFVGLWYLGMACCSVFLFTEGSARYILPLVPPVLLVFFRRLETSEVTEYRQARQPFIGAAALASGSLVVSLAWGLALSQADQDFARIYPRAARELAGISDGLPCYYGGEWGFRYYMGLAGIEQLPVDETRVQGGSMIALPKLALAYELPADLRSMIVPVQTLAYDVSTPLRTMDWQTPAGFYSSAWGLIPFSFSRKSLESVEVSQVSFLIERLPWARKENPGTVEPWPGYAAIQGKNTLALLVKPGTTVVYPWLMDHRVDMTVHCAVAPDGSRSGDDGDFRFEIVQRDEMGRVLAQCAETLRPGGVKNDRGWCQLRLALVGRAQGARTLELRFSGPSASATGAFADGILTPVH
jgi:hypothetical protein